MTSSSAGTWDGVERRKGDRRGRPTRFWDSFTGKRQRRGGRRSRDRDELYVDRYTRRDTALLVSIFVLNIADAVFTLEWLGRGGTEGNPLMAHLIQLGSSAFLIQKIALPAFWLMLLTIHKNFRLARNGMWALFGAYGALALYHLLLFFFGTPAPPADAAALGQLWEPAFRASSLAC